MESKKKDINLLELAKRNKELNAIQEVAMIGSWTFYSKDNLVKYKGHGGIMHHDGEIDLDLKGYSDLVLPDDRETFMGWAIRNMQGDITDPVSFRIRFEEKIYYMKAKTLNWEKQKDGSFIADGYAQNVTEIQQNRNDINLLTHAVSNAVENIFAADEEGNLIFANRMFRRFHNIPMDADITQLKLYQCNCFIENEDQWKQFIESIRKGERIHGFIIRHPLPLYPEILAIEANGYWVTDDSGKGTIWMFGRDITEMVVAQQKLREAKERAEESDRLKSAFLANMSHEIRTPLNAIVGFSRIIAETESLEERRMFHKIVEENNDRLLQLVNEILDLSKIEANMAKLDIQSVDLDNLCREIHDTFSLRCPAEVQLVIDPPQEHLQAKGDKNRIFQILSNLIDNALKFTSQGSIHYGYRKKDNMIEMYVTDTGQGIKPDMIDTVFDRFVKANDMAQGTGLGLAICKMLVEKMNGQIEVHSEYGKGATFTFTLPMNQPAENGDA